ncbi:phosphotransferase family protein [Haladaptatus sp. NG-WS-4]
MSGERSSAEGTTGEYQRAVRAVTETFPDATVTEVSPFDRGKNEVYSLRIERDSTRREAVLKIGTATDDAAFRVEPDLLRLVARRTSIPVPRVLGSDSGEVLGVPFFIMERVDGVNLELRPDELPPDVLERVCFEAGVHLGELHAAFDFDAFGPVRRDKSGTVHVASEFDSWPELFETAVKANADQLTETRFSDLVPRLKSLAETASSRLDGEFDPVLMHHDYRLANLLLDSDAVAGNWDGGTVTNAVLDWGEPATGHAEYELVQTEAVLTNRPELQESRQKRLRERLYEGYNRTNSLARDGRFSDRRHCYRLSTLVRLMKNFETIAEISDADPAVRAEEHRRTLESWGESS